MALCCTGKWKLSLKTQFPSTKHSRSHKYLTAAIGLMSKKSIKMTQDKQCNFIGAGSFGNPWGLEKYENKNSLRAHSSFSESPSMRPKNNEIIF